MKVILASGSPRRKKLLEQINLNFEVQVSNASEDYKQDQEPSNIVQELALRKAEQIAGHGQNATQDLLVIGADTLVVFDNEILEKPATEEEACVMLEKLANSHHEVLTGVALIKKYVDGNKTNVLTFVEKTMVIFGDIEKSEIHEYVQSGSPMDKAGGYGIQDDWGSVFVKKL
ncbi:MAG: Maf family protein [Balneolaceae bacterium]|nr:Maf family protein [Balneolaceae bacterium]